MLGIFSKTLDSNVVEATGFAGADFIILDENPLENIRNTNTISRVMKNGRLYDANTLDEVYPRQKKAVEFWWHDKKPANLPGLNK